MDDFVLPGTVDHDPAEAQCGVETESPWTMRHLNRMVEEYESQCCLLGSGARERLTQCGKQREAELARQIELTASLLRERREDSDHVTGDHERADAETALRKEVAVLRKEIVAVAATLAGNGVREFANCLLVSQGRLGVHADLLREYTAVLANEILDRLGESEVFRIEPLSPWRQDPVTHNAIEACEKTIAERRQVGDVWLYGVAELNGTDLIWCAVVQEWEAFKAAERIRPGSRERIPESTLRTILSRHSGVMPNDVTWEQIRRAGADLCRHYGRVLVIPLELETDDPPEPAPASVASAQFWKEREDEFRRHDTPENNLLATWFSPGDGWLFRTGAGVKSRTPGSEQVFKSLAREAATGLAGSRNGESWVDWLNALRCATDTSTGSRLYSKLSATGTLILSERELDRMVKSGEPIPSGGVWEFVAPSEHNADAVRANGPEAPPDAGAAERRWFWETTSETIGCLFTSSANFCLELRSRAGCRGENNGNKSATQNLRRGYRAEVKKWMKDKGLRSIPDAAERLCVGLDSLKSIMSSKGEKRYGDELLKTVLEKIKR